MEPEERGSPLWVDPEIAVEKFEIPLEDLPWHIVYTMAETPSTPTASESGKRRIRFEVQLRYHRCSGVLGLDDKNFPSGGALVLLGRHGILWSW